MSPAIPSPADETGSSAPHGAGPVAASSPDTAVRVRSTIARRPSTDAPAGPANDSADDSAHHPPYAPPDRVPGGWGDDLTRSSLQLLAESLTQLTGFTVAAIAIVGDDDRLHPLAVSGSLGAWQRLREAHRVEALDEALAVADDWGAFRFVPADRVVAVGLARPTWTSPEQSVRTTLGDTAPTAWQPLDMLIAPLRDDSGRLRGTLSIDVPRDGRRPSPRMRRQLDRYAELATRAVVTALERERLAKDVRLAEVARQVIREAAQDLSLGGIVEHTGDTLVESFRLAGLTTMLFDAPGGEPVLFGAGLRLPPTDPVLTAMSRQVAQRLWHEQDVAVLGRDQEVNVAPSPPRRARVLDYLARNGLGSALHVPLGSGDTVLGSMTFLRDLAAPAWTDAELEVAGEIGRDLGGLLVTARAFQRQQELAEQLRTLDSRKSRLIAVLSHELKNPLSAVVTNLELLEEGLGPRDRDQVVEALSRSASRMAAIAEDLQVFSEAGGADGAAPRAVVDLAAVAREVVDLARPAAERHGLSLRVADTGAALLVRGDSRALFRALSNLVSNAVKYTPAGGRVAVALHRRGNEAAVAVSDTGIGIPDGERDRLFEEFYRAEDPRARSQPGSGLGLAIVDRIVRRHGGRVEVESAQGLGSTFRLVLPAGDDA